MPIYTLGQLRTAASGRDEYNGLSDADMVRRYSHDTGQNFEQMADYFGVKKEGLFDATARALGGGVMSDVPKMAGQALQYTGIAPEYGKEMADAAEARGINYEPDNRGRSWLGGAMVSGARALPAVGAIAPLAFIPGVGTAVAATAGATLFGASAAQETYDKLIGQDVGEEEAAAAARRVAFVQGPLEGLATVSGVGAARGLAPMLGLGRKTATTGAVAADMTNTAIAKPFLKGLAINAGVQTGTEVAQDLGTYGIEQAYGAKAEDPWAIANSSAQGGFGLSMILGGFGLGSHARRSTQAKALNQMLYGDGKNPVNPEEQLAARDIITMEAVRRGVPAEEAEAWYQRQVREDGQGMEMLKQHEDTIVEQGKESPAADISYALTDPELGAKISGKDREELISISNAVQQGQLAPEAQADAITAAQEIIGRYLVAEADPAREHDLMRPPALLSGAAPVTPAAPAAQITPWSRPSRYMQVETTPGLTQVETHPPGMSLYQPPAQPAPVGLGRTATREPGTAVPGVPGMREMAPGVFQTTPAATQVETTKRQAPAPVVAPVPATTGAVDVPKAPKAKQAKAQRQQPSAAVAGVAQQVDDEAQLAKLLEDPDSAIESEVDPLKATVTGAETVHAPGRTSLDTTSLRKIRDALLRRTGKVSGEGVEREQRITDALREFGRLYQKHSTEGGQGISHFSRVKKLSNKEDPSGSSTLARANADVDKLEKTAKAVQGALRAVGEAVGGNAKDVEVVIRLVKDMAQGRIAAPGKSTELITAAGKTLDTMLSQAWTAAKSGVYLDGSPGLDYLRSGSIRNAREQAAGMSPLEKAATEGVGGINQKNPGPLRYGAQAVMQYLRNHGTAFERVLARALRGVLERQHNALMDSDLSAKEKEKSELKLEFIDKGPSNFVPATNTLKLNRNASAEVSLHEVLHAALQSYVRSHWTDPRVMILRRSLQKVVDYTGPVTGKALEVQNLLKKLVAEKNEMDAVLELVSYGATLADFRTLLKTMKSDEAPPRFRADVENIWRYIKAVLSRLLGSPGTVASDVLEASVVLLEKAQTKAHVRNDGKPLQAAVTSESPVSKIDQAKAGALGVTPQDYRRYDESNALQFKVTERVFNLIGINEKNMRAMTEKLAAKARAAINKSFPKLEIALGMINSRYNVNSMVSRIMDDYKVHRGVGYQYAENIANTILRRDKEDVLAIFSYLDGNKTALDKLPDAKKLKFEADGLKESFDKYVAVLSPVEQRYFNTNKFSESLLFAADVKEVAGNKFGLTHLNKVLGTERAKDHDLDEAWFQRDDDGNLVTSGVIYRVFEPDATTPAGFMSAAKYIELGSPATVLHEDRSFVVSTKKRWIFEGHKDGVYNFINHTTVRESIEAEKVEAIANALRNTIAALANNYASKTFITSLAAMGHGDSPHAQVAFDSVEVVNKEFETDVREDQVLTLSDTKSRSPLINEQYRMTGTWVRLPKASETFGDLAGKLVPGPVWHAMNDMADRQPLINIRAVNTIMRYFKKSKTSQNPGTHVTNTASNFTMAMAHDVSFRTIGDAMALLTHFETNRESLSDNDLAFVKAFRESGAMVGLYSNAEVKAALYQAHRKNMLPGSDTSVITKAGGWLAYEKAKSEAMKKLNHLDDLATQVYSFEDNVFRLALFMKTAGHLQNQAGVKTPTPEMLRMAGDAARKGFGDYDIDSKAVQMARQSVLPFISWGYAMAPVIGRIAVYQPWRMANLYMGYMVLEAAFAAAAGDDEEQREQGPEAMREKMFGTFGPYMHLRIPFMGDDKNPVYYKLGDYFPQASFTRGLPNGLAGQTWVPAMVTPGGPLLAGLTSITTGVDLYTGKKTWQDTDTNLERAWTVSKQLYDIMGIPALSSKNASRVQDIIDDKKGITGVEPSSLFIARAFGMKFYDYNVDEQAAQNVRIDKAITSEFKTAMTKAKREEYSKGVPDYEALDKTLDSLRERMEKRLKERRGDED